MDESGRWSNKKSGSEALLPLFATPNTMMEIVPREESADSQDKDKEKEHKHKPKRKQSIMGELVLFGSGSVQ